MDQPVVHDQVAGLETRATGLSAYWPVIGALAIGIALISAMFLREIQAAIEVWTASTAYSHCYLVLPMTLYLLWERRDVISCRRAEPELRFVWAAIPLTLFWLMAERLGIMEARQLAVVAGIELLFLTVLGRRLYWHISGPLLFLFFLVPFGAFLTPGLQQFTADFSIIGLNLLGIPNFSDGFTIETPAGVFFVAEACAGLRFLIASIAFGVFYSLLSYVSPTRRALFIAASIIVPIIANGFRALGIVVLGQVLGSAEAAAADHLIYGWVFFSVVMLLLIAGGHVFREVFPIAVDESASVSMASMRSPVWGVALVVLMLGLGPAVAGVIDARLAAPTLPTIATVVAPAGCSSVNEGSGGPSTQKSFTITCDGMQFEVNVMAFAARSTASAMISERRRVTQEVGAENAAISAVRMPDGAGSWTVVQTTDPNRVTAYAGWVDGAPIQSGMAGRIAQARDSVLGTAFAPALITVTTAEPANSSPGRRKQTLERLTALLSAQAGLNAHMATLTKIGSN